jgi:hypothetical protein
MRHNPDLVLAVETLSELGALASANMAAIAGDTKEIRTHLHDLKAQGIIRDESIKKLMELIVTLDTKTGTLLTEVGMLRTDVIEGFRSHTKRLVKLESNGDDSEVTNHGR